MHNIDRTQAESTGYEFGLESGPFEFYEAGEFPGTGELGESGQYESGPYESGHYEAGEAGESAYETPYESAYETPYESTYETPYESAYESGAYESGSYESGEFYESPFNEQEVMEFAAEFLEITNEQELDHFLGGLLKKAGRAVGSFMKTPTGNAVGGILKSALPIAGSALGGMVGGPLGASLGGKLASAAGGLFGLELGEMSGEDRQFEVAKQFVRLSGAAAQKAAQLDRRMVPTEAAKQAVIAAAQVFAPGLIPAARALSTAGTARNTGRWFRQGGRVVLLGV